MTKKQSIQNNESNKLIKKWAGKKSPLVFHKMSKNIKSDISTFSFLDFEQKEIQQVVKNFIMSDESLNSMSKDEKASLAVFCLLQIVKYIAPKDNRDFVSRSLIHLKKNPMVQKVLLGLVQMELYELEEGEVNLPELGIFATPTITNKYTFAIPRSPKEVLLVYMGSSSPAVELMDQEIVDYSYSLPQQSIILSNKNTLDITNTMIIEKQKINERKIGDLCRQMEDPKAISNIVKSFLINMPGIKDNMFLHKPVEMALRLWNK
jgi:hypothetical protein